MQRTDAMATIAPAFIEQQYQSWSAEMMEACSDKSH
jgi:hypothetical protein